VLRRAADLLALGADPATAWTDPNSFADNHAAALLRLARRSASSGAALAQGVAELADQSRNDAADAASATAARASVLIAGPLGLCYLPAFVCLGVVPVVVGLAGEIMMVANKFRALWARLTLMTVADDGMSTVEYAIGTIAAAAFGAILYTVITGDSIVSALTNIINRALNTNV
jgi:hypothetical protein